MSTISVTNIADGDAVTAASINNQVNTIVNDYNGNITAANLAANAVTSAKITNANVTPDKLGTGAAAAFVVTSESTASTSFVDLTTTTDTVTVTIGANGLALVAIYADITNSGANYSRVGFAASGANTVAAANNLSIAFNGTTFLSASATFLLTGLSTGSTVFKMKYNVSAGTGTFDSRRIAVIPL